MKWLKRSLFAKLLIGMLISAVLPFTLSNIISYITTSSSVENQVIELNQNSMDSSMENMKRYLDELNRISISFYQNETLMGLLRKQELNPYEALLISKQVDNIYNLRLEFRGVSFISLQNDRSFYKLDNSRIGVPYDAALITPLRSHSNTKKTDYQVTSLANERVLAITKQLVDYPSSRVLGFLTLYVGLEEIRNLIQPQAIPSDDQVFVYINNQQLLYASQGEAPSFLSDTIKTQAGSRNNGFFQGELKGEQGIYIYVNKSYLDLPLTLVKFVPTSTINKSADQTLNRSLFIQVVAIIFVIILAFILSYRTIAPVRRLLRNIAQVETGRFDLHVTENRTDELGVLENRFQTMVRNLDDLMNREYRYRLELSTAQLKMLQAQINPHFLYNALQTIGTLALRHGSDEISDKLADLGAILRYSMDFKQETVTLQREIQHIEHYLSLQMSRFKNRLSYTLDCSKEALRMSVPKMILQPLVENSIIHGIEKGRGSGILHISIEHEEDLCIRVMDNGKGIPPELIERIHNEYSGFQIHSGNEHGIGLTNVLHRMRLYYGVGFTWEIHSIPYEMTVLTLYVKSDYLWKEGA